MIPSHSIQFQQSYNKPGIVPRSSSLRFLNLSGQPLGTSRNMALNLESYLVAGPLSEHINIWEIPLRGKPLNTGLIYLDFLSPRSWSWSPRCLGILDYNLRLPSCPFFATQGQPCPTLEFANALQESLFQRCQPSFRSSFWVVAREVLVAFIDL